MTGAATVTRLALASLALLLAAGLPLASAQGGGSVSNVPPTIESFESEVAVAGRWTNLSGVAADRNGEADLVEVRLHRASPAPALWANHTVAAADLQATSAPANATAGWRVWNPVANDGRLSWSFEWAPEAARMHAWNLTASDEALAASRTLDVSVGTTGGGASSGGDGSEPPPTSPPPGDPGPAPDPGDPGDPDPEDPLADVPRDLSSTLRVTRAGGQVGLEWDPVPGALGYQVWRSTSPWTLRAELGAGDTQYQEPDPGKDAVYKVTFFTERTAAGGWAPDGEHAPGIPGWDESAGVPLDDDGGGTSADDGAGRRRPAVPVALGVALAVAAIGAVGTAAFVLRKRP